MPFPLPSFIKKITTWPCIIKWDCGLFLSKTGRCYSCASAEKCKVGLILAREKKKLYSFTVFFQAFAFVLPQEHVNLFGSFQLCALHVQHLLSSFWTCFYLCLAFEKSLSLVFYITDMISHCQIFSAGFCTLKFHYSLHYPFPFGILPKGRWFFILQLSDCISE